MSVALLAMVSVCVLQYEQLCAMRSMDSALRMAWHLPGGNELTTTWTSGGVTHTITTNHADNWTLSQWQDRHFNAVRMEQQSFPPDQ